MGFNSRDTQKNNTSISKDMGKVFKLDGNKTYKYNKMLYQLIWDRE